jgi:hypothetical protein
MPENITSTRRAIQRLIEIGFRDPEVRRLKTGGLRITLDWTDGRRYVFLLSTAFRPKIARWKKRAEMLRADGIIYYNPHTEYLSIVFLKPRAKREQYA